MIKSVYAVRDNKVGFLDPVFEVNDDVAIRNFSYAINNATGMMAFAPSDFDFYRIGSFDTETSVLTDLTPPVMVVSGSSVYKRKDDAADS